MKIRYFKINLYINNKDFHKNKVSKKKYTNLKKKKENYYNNKEISPKNNLKLYKKIPALINNKI